MADATVNRGGSLSPRQMGIAAIYGVAVWFAAAVVLRLIGPMGVYDIPLRLLLYIAIIPGTVPVIWLARKLVRAEPGQLVPTLALGTATATLSDGTALAWFPTLYGENVSLHAGAGGTILWGAGVGLLLAFVMEREE